MMVVESANTPFQKQQPKGTSMYRLVDFGRPIIPPLEDHPPIWEETTSEKIAKWDLSKPAQFLIKRKGMDEREVTKMVLEYKRLLMLCADNPHVRFPMSEKVDTFLHSHILFTEDYKEFCVEIFGGMRSHHPVLTEEQRLSLMPDYRGTLSAYRNRFGTPDPVMWPQDGHEAAICWGGNDD